MNLTKSFNKEFFLQMLKKSKGIVIFSIIIMPLLLSMYIILTAIDTNYSIVFNTNITKVISVGMYIMPLFYSSIFFGYVFKKKSIDFMGSLPINRKTIFVTGTIGGILLMLLVHLIMLFLIFFYGFVFRNIIIMPSAIIDGMIMSFLGFVFVYTATNLAMTFTGTFLTQVLVTCMILFIVPISTLTFKEFGELNFKKDLEVEGLSYEYDYDYFYDSYNTLIKYDDEDIYVRSSSGMEEFTLPFGLIVGNRDFSYVVICKMTILSIVYSIIGYKIFKRRNMENTGQSVGTNRAHLILKAIALYPVILLFNLIDMYSEIDASSLITPIIIFGIFYYIFDYIIKRKMPFKTTIMSYFASLIVLEMIVGSVRILYRPSIREIDSDTIKSISVGEINDNRGIFDSYMYYLYGDSGANLDGNYYIKDDEFKELILDSLNDNYKRKTNSNSYKYYEEYDDTEYGYIPTENIDINIKTKAGKVYTINSNISKKYYNEIIDYLNDDEEYQENLAKNIKKNNAVYYLNSWRPATRKETKILNSITDDIDLFDYIMDEDTIVKRVYKNHRLIDYYIPVRLLEEYEEWNQIEYKYRDYWY